MSWPRPKAGMPTRPSTSLARPAPPRVSDSRPRRRITCSTSAVRCSRPGTPSTSLATLEQAIDIGQRCGDLRTVAFARTRLAQVLRTQGETATALDFGRTRRGLVHRGRRR